MVNKRLLSLCDESKKWIGMTVLMNWISIICNIATINTAEPKIFILKSLLYSLSITLPI